MLSAPASKMKSGPLCVCHENARWQCDLVDNTKFVQSSNKNYKYFCISIDVFSRKLYAEPQENKNPYTTLASFKTRLASEADADTRLHVASTARLLRNTSRFGHGASLTAAQAATMASRTI